MRRKVDEYFEFKMPRVRKVFLPNRQIAPGRDRNEAMAQLRAARRRMQEAFRGSEEWIDALPELHLRRTQLLTAAHLLEAGVRFNHRAFGLLRREIQDLEPSIAEVSQSWQAAWDQLEDLVVAAEDRLHAALVLRLSSGEDDSLTPSAEELVKLAGALLVLKSRWREFFELGRLSHSLRALLSQWARRRNRDRYAVAVSRLAEGIRQSIARLWSDAPPARYPFAAESETTPLRSYLAIEADGGDSPPALLSRVEGGLKRAYDLYDRILGELVATAVRTEDRAPPESVITASAH